MNEIKCFENYYKLRDMFLRGDRGDMQFFTNRVGIKPRTFYRLLHYLEKIDGIIVVRDSVLNIYHIQE